VGGADYMPVREGAAQGPPWLVPRGTPDSVSWPRTDPGWLERFRALHRGSDEDVAAFAGRFGWLRLDPFDAAKPELPGTTLIVDANADQPLWADNVRAWRAESLAIEDLLTVLAAIGTVEQGGEVSRRRIVSHFSGADGQTLWLRLGDHLGRPAAGKDWRVEHGPGSGGDVRCIAFLYGPPPESGLRRWAFVPMPVKGGPRRGSGLATAEPVELATLARHALAAVIQGVLGTETSGVMTLDDSIRVMPNSLLGALYLSLARELFNRRSAKICPVCREPFTPRDSRQDYCNRGTGCRSKAYRQRRDQAALRTRAKS